MLILRPSSLIATGLSSAVRRGVTSLHSLLGAPASSSESSDIAPGLRLQQQDLVQQPQQPGFQLPTLCGEPKNKLSLHRRGNRRISYYAKHKGLFAHCKHCGVSGMPHQWFAANNSRCSGQCLQPPASHYLQGYKPPC